MATEQPKEEVQSPRVHSHRTGLLRQPEIEEVDEEDTSPGSDQSDTTITAGTDTPRVVGGESPETGSPDDLKPTISPKIKQLTRSEAICEGCASPPLDPLQSTASTCSTDSSSSGIGTKSLTSGSGSGSSFRGRLEKDGSQSSEAGTSSSLSRDSSVDTPYKDSTGIDLEDFIKKTLNKTPKDRSMLIKLEVDLIKFIKEPKHHYLKFPHMSSYDRMLVHRIAAFFGLDHNVDQTGKCVIVNKTANTRIPDFSFQDHITSSGGESKPKMLLKRGGGSYDESQSRNLQKPTLDSTRAAKSLEERQQQYEEIRSRIFTGEEQGEVQPYTQEEMSVSMMKGVRPATLTKDEHVSDGRGYGLDGSLKTRIVVPKANSFGGTGTFVLQPMKSPMRCSSLTKADSLSMQVGSLQPTLGSPVVRPVLMSSPTCSQSDASSVSGSSSSGLAPSPQQQPSNAGSLPTQSSPGPKIYWTPSEMAPSPPGGVIINPQTGQPLCNPDGSVYRYTPGQPLPQVWTAQMSQESQSSQQELCQQMTTVLMLSQQSSQDSSDSGCAAGGDSGTIPQQVVINQNTQQQQQQQQQPVAQQQQQPFHQQQIPQQHAVMVGQHQGVYFPGAQPGVQGQPAVRYMCPVNYCVSNTGSGYPQGYTPGQGVQIEGHNQSLQYQNNPYHQQYVQGYPGNQIFGQGQGQFIGQGHPSYQCAAAAHGVTSPVEGQTGSMTIGYNVPVQYNQQTMNVPTSFQQYYAVQTAAQNQQQPQMSSYSAFSGQQQTTYQNNTPPSQGSCANPNVQLNTLQTAQPGNVNTINTVNIPQQQAAGMAAPQGLGAQPAPAAQFISYPSSHHNLTHNPQVPQTFTSPQIRPIAPKVVPLHGVPMHGQAPAQTFQTVYQPNMQMPMQIHPHPSQQQQPVVVTKSPHVGGAQQVTVSAKSVSYDPSPVSGAGENGSGEKGSVTPNMDGQTTVGNSYRPPQHISSANHGEIRLQYQSKPAQVPPTPTFTQPQQQSLNKSPTAPKPQRIKKSRSRDSQQSQQSTDTGTMLMSNILEVCDLPSHLKWSEIDKLLQDLIGTGAKIVGHGGDQDGSQGDSNSNNSNSNNQTISGEMRVFAVFPDSGLAAHVMQTHSSSSYKLQPVETIAESQA